MKPKGVNRVVIAVRDLDAAMETYSRLLGATFHDTSAGAEPFGVRVAMSWDAGIELCSPLPGRNSYVEKIIKENGEGLVGVVFCVDDVEEAYSRADEMGISVLATVDYDQKTIDQYLEGRFKKYKEYMLSGDPLRGVGMIVGQIEPKESGSF